MLNEDELRLAHILDAAKEIASFIDGKTEQDLRSDRLLLLALQKLIEIIGEAATQLSDDITTVRLREPSGSRDRYWAWVRS